MTNAERAAASTNRQDTEQRQHAEQRASLGAMGCREQAALGD